jgi:hypothetical protein
MIGPLHKASALLLSLPPHIKKVRLHVGYSISMPGFAEAVALVYRLRLTGETYRTAVRQLTLAELTLNRKRCYNLVRG